MHIWRINRYAADYPYKDEVTHVFVLVIWLGIGADRRVISDDIEFTNLQHCIAYAQMIVMRFGYQTPQDRALAYCIPKRVVPEA